MKNQKIMWGLRTTKKMSIDVFQEDQSTLIKVSNIDKKASHQLG